MNPDLRQAREARRAADPEGQHNAQDYAQRLGVSAVTVSLVERGRRAIGRTRLRDWERVYGLPVGSLGPPPRVVARNGALLLDGQPLALDVAAAELSALSGQRLDALADATS